MVKWWWSIILVGSMAEANSPTMPTTPAVPPPIGQQTAPKEVPPAEASKIQSYLEPFFYDQTKARDPFETQGSASPLTQGQVYGPFLKVQNYKLNSFKLKGLVWNVKKPMALFLAPDGSEFRLGIKDYIGENFGYIAAIREKEVVIIQTIEEDNKRYSTTKVVFLE